MTVIEAHGSAQGVRRTGRGRSRLRRREARGGRGRRRGPRDRARRDARLHRAQRRRQVDDAQDADRRADARPRGEVRVCGLVPVRQRTRLARRIGVVFGQRSQLWWDLPLRDSFDLLRHIYRVPAADHAARLRRCRDAARPRRVPRHAGAAALARPADARRADRRAAARPGGAVPRRADDRPRRGEQAGGPGVPRRARRRAATPRSCSPPTTWPTSSGCAGGWSSSTTAGWCTTARSRRCTPGTARAAGWSSTSTSRCRRRRSLPGAALRSTEADGRRLEYDAGHGDRRRGDRPPGRPRRAARRVHRGARHRGRGGPPLHRRAGHGMLHDQHGEGAGLQRLVACAARRRRTWRSRPGRGRPSSPAGPVRMPAGRRPRGARRCPGCAPRRRRTAPGSMLDDVDVAARVAWSRRRAACRCSRAWSERIRGPSPARITRIAGAGGSTSRLNGTSSATPSDQSVSTLGLPTPASSWESVDLAMPARRASSVRDRPARSRSRRSAAAIVAPSGRRRPSCSLHRSIRST